MCLVWLFLHLSQHSYNGPATTHEHTFLSKRISPISLVGLWISWKYICKLFRAGFKSKGSIALLGMPLLTLVCWKAWGLRLQLNTWQLVSASTVSSKVIAARLLMLRFSGTCFIAEASFQICTACATHMIGHELHFVWRCQLLGYDPICFRHMLFG